MFSPRNYWRWLCKILLGKETVAGLYLARSWKLGCMDAMCADSEARGARESPRSDPEAHILSYWEGCY